MKWPSTKFFQGIGLAGFTLGVFNTINVYKSKKNVAANLHEIIKNSEQSYKKIEELANYYSNGDEIVKEQIKNYMLKCIELKIQSNPSKNLNATTADEALKEIDLIHNKIIFKTNVFNNTVNPVEKNFLQEEINNLNHQIESKLSLAQDNINAIKSNFTLTQTELLKIIEDFKRDGGGGNKFIESDLLNKILDNFNHYLSTLNLEQSLAITNLFGIFIILVTLISIIFIFYGNIILNYFNLEDRYPKIANIIILRRKFQQYYLLWNIVLITIVLVVMFLINLTMLF